MKKLISIAVISTVALSVNAKSSLYAKVNGEVLKCTENVGATAMVGAHVRSTGECSSYEFMTGDAFCFTGQRSELIDAINGDEFDFDEEWLDGASYKGKDLKFFVNDGPNELSEAIVAKKCTQDFFKKYMAEKEAKELAEAYRPLSTEDDLGKVDSAKCEKIKYGYACEFIYDLPWTYDWYGMFKADVTYKYDNHGGLEIDTAKVEWDGSL